jgi:uncharacterized protein (DUF433 family)
MSDVPGIIVSRRPEQSARIAETGIEVFEVVKVYRSVDEDWERLRGAFHWLSAGQLRAALTYAAEHPDEISERLMADKEGPERLKRLWKRYPATAPKRR